LAKVSPGNSINAEHARIPEKDVLKHLLDQMHEVTSRSVAFQMFCQAIGQIGFNGAMFTSRASGATWLEDIAETTYPREWGDHYVAAGYTRPHHIPRLFRVAAQEPPQPDTVRAGHEVRSRR
jgi:hypothetical protein